MPQIQQIQGMSTSEARRVVAQALEDMAERVTPPMRR